MEILLIIAPIKKAAINKSNGVFIYFWYAKI